MRGPIRHVGKRMIISLPQTIIGNPWKFSHDPAADPKHAFTDEVHFEQALIEFPAKTVNAMPYSAIFMFNVQPIGCAQRIWDRVYCDSEFAIRTNPPWPTTSFFARDCETNRAVALA